MLTEYLISTRDRFLRAVDGLSDAQWTFKPDSETWSTAECAEHIVVTEQLSLKRLQGATIAQVADQPQTSDWHGRDEALVAGVEGRQTKFQAPAFVVPANRWPTSAEIVAAFQQARAATLAHLTDSSPELRSRFARHPAVGKIDAHQWLLLMAAHTERHVRQIEELKAHQQYPAA